MVKRKVNDSQFSIRIPQEMKDTIFRLAEEEGVDAVDWIRAAINERLKRIQGKDNSMLISDDEFEKRFNQLFDKRISEMSILSGTIHGISIAESNNAGFEKIGLRAQRRY